MTTTTPLVVAMAVGLLLAPLVAEAQPAGKVYRVGYLGTAQPGPEIGRAHV